MHQKIITSLSVISVLLFGCSKSNQPSPKTTNSSSIKISLVSGGGQTDTIGRQLPNSVYVKITQNGSPVSNYGVQFKGSGCNQDNIITVGTQADGTAGYNWSLAGDVGPQTLMAYAINAQNQKVDSVAIPATALATGSGWHFSACSIPFGVMVSSFCKLSTGRLFATFNGIKISMRYSDDNGISWNPVKGLGNTHNPNYVVSSSTDELFVFSQAEGVYYSNDGGTTFTAINSVSNFVTPSITTADCTPSGKLIVTNTGGVFVSLDKGKTWSSKSSGSFVQPNSSGGDNAFGEPAEDQAGNLYVVGHESETIYKSADNGQTWVPQPKPQQFTYDDSFYIDKNNWFYLSSNQSGNGVYISKDKGATYTLMLNTQSVFVDNMSLQSDGNFYYEDLGLAPYLVKATGSSTPVENIFSYNFPEIAPYIVAKNNNIIAVNNSDNFIKYYTK